MSDSPTPFLTDSDPLGPEARTKLRQLLADGGVVDTVDDALNPVRDGAPDGRVAWQEFAERVASGDRGRGTAHGLPKGGGARYRLRRGGFKEGILRQRVWSTAVACMLALIIGALGWKGRSYHAGHGGVGSSLTYTTGNGERATITLPDGGMVALNVASHLEVPTDYAAGNHTVRLVGEGVFTVQRHTGTPFTVLAGPAEVRVLGTSFLIRKYATDSVATVAVREGKVSVRSSVLTVGEQVAVSRVGVGDVQRADFVQFNFTRGILTLDGMPFQDAIVELDRWYDADIRLGDPRLATRRIAIEVGAGSLAELTYNLEHTYKVRVVRNGRVLTLYPEQ